MTKSIVWISGATQGMGAVLADLAAESGARVINLDRVPSDRHETIAFDLTDPESWGAVAAGFGEVFAKGDVDRATLLVVGHANIGQGILSRVDLDSYRTSFVANGVGPIMLGSLFLRNLPADVRGGLMLMSSGSAGRPVIGQSSYSACKCAIEGWVRVVKEEIIRESRDAWLVAVRPGFVDTPSTRELANADLSLYPRAQKMGASIEKYAVTAAIGARRIWDALPPPDEARIISFDGKPEDGPQIIA